MRRIPLGQLSLLFCLEMAIFFGGSAAVRGFVLSDRDGDIEKAHKENRELQAQHDNDAWLLRAAQGQGKDAAVDFFGKLKEQLKTSEFKDKDVTTVLKRAKQFSELPADLLAAIDPGNARAGLRALASDPLYGRIGAFGANYPLTELLRGTKRLPEPELKLKPVPEPKRFFAKGWWLWTWLIACWLFAILFWFIFGLMEEDESYHLVKSYPWNRPLALLYCAAAAPGTAPALAVYGLVRLLIADWKEPAARGWQTLRAAAYQFRLIRHLPAPAIVVHEAALPTVGVGAVLAAAAPPPVPAVAVEENGPQWYVVSREVFLGLSDVLTENALRLFPIAIKAPKEIAGYAVPAGSIESFEQALRLTAAEATDEETDIERTVRRNYKRVCGKIDVVGFNEKTTETVRTILRTVSAYAGGIGIVVESFGGKTVEPVHDDDRLHIVYGGTPSAEPAPRELRRAFGRDIAAGALTAVRPDHTRGILIQDDDGNPVIQVVDATVYLLVNGLIGLSFEHRWAEEALVRFLHEAFRHAIDQLKTTDTDDAKADRWRQSLETHRDKYVALSFKRFEQTKADLDRQIAACEREIINDGLRITARLKERQQAEAQRRIFIEKEGPEAQDRLRKEFEQLAASKCVIGVSCSDSGVEVQTRTVFIPWKGRRYKIGRFLIRLGDNGQIVIVNVANTATGTNYHHPHVPSSGTPCFGQMQEAIAKLMADRQYATIVGLLFRFFESYNHHGGVEDIRKWKEVTSETNG